MQHFELKGTTRTVGNKAIIKSFRKSGLVPCNLYGCGMENVLFTVAEKDLALLTNTPISYIVDIVLDGNKKYSAILHETQWHPVSDICLHVDFLAVDDKKPIAISVPVEIVGHSIGVQQGGKFSQNSRSIRVSALMKDLPEKVSIDISSLGLDKRIKAGDVKLDKVSVITDKDTIICGVVTTRNVTTDDSASAA